MASAYVSCLGLMFMFEGQDVGMDKARQAPTSWHKDPEVGRMNFVSGHLGTCHLMHCYQAG